MRQNSGHGVAVPGNDETVRVEFFQWGQKLLFELGCFDSLHVGRSFDNHII